MFCMIKMVFFQKGELYLFCTFSILKGIMSIKLIVFVDLRNLKENAAFYKVVQNYKLLLGRTIINIIFPIMETKRLRLV